MALNMNGHLCMDCIVYQACIYACTNMAAYKYDFHETRFNSKAVKASNASNHCKEITSTTLISCSHLFPFIFLTSPMVSVPSSHSWMIHSLHSLQSYLLLFDPEVSSWVTLSAVV